MAQVRILKKANGTPTQHDESSDSVQINSLGLGASAPGTGCIEADAGTVEEAVPALRTTANITTPGSENNVEIILENSGAGTRACRLVMGGTIDAERFAMQVDSAGNDTQDWVVRDLGAGIRLRLTSAGFFGVGPTAPAVQFHVDSNAANTVAIMRLENTGGDVDFFVVAATPESSVTGSIGDIAIDRVNGVLYQKVTGTATNTGWAAIGLVNFAAVVAAVLAGSGVTLSQGAVSGGLDGTSTNGVTETLVPEDSSAIAYRHYKIVRHARFTTSPAANLFTYTLASGDMAHVHAVWQAHEADPTPANDATYERTMSFSRVNGTMQNVGAEIAISASEDVGTWGGSIDFSGNDIRVRFATGVTTTVDCMVEIDLRVWTPPAL